MTDPVDAHKWNRKRQRNRKIERAAWCKKVDGSQGAASSCKRLDPQTLKVVEEIAPSAPEKPQSGYVSFQRRR